MATTWSVAGTTVDDFPNDTPLVKPGNELSLELWFTSNGAANYEARADTLAEYLKYAHTSVWDTDIDGDVAFRLRSNDNDPVSTHVVDFYPGSDVNATGFWALVVGGKPEDRGLEGLRILTFDVVVLAARDDYLDASAVETALGESI